MSYLAVRIENADRIMNRATVDDRGIVVTFADGRKGRVPFSAIPELGSHDNVADLKLHPYVLMVVARTGEVVELPWDFARHYCDKDYRERSESAGLAGRRALGERIRRHRERTKMSQGALASVANVGRVTLARIETGGQSPRYETLHAIAKGLGLSVEELLTAS